MMLLVSDADRTGNSLLEFMAKIMTNSAVPQTNEVCICSFLNFTLIRLLKQFCVKTQSLKIFSFKICALSLLLLKM